MKIHNANFIVMFFLFVGIGTAQTDGKTFVPHFIENGQAMDFERVVGKMETKSIGFGYGGANRYLTVFDGPQSPVRFNAATMPKFVIRVDDGTDLLGLVVIAKADVTKKKKNYRRFVQQGYSFGGGAKDIGKYTMVPKLKLLNGNLYEMEFDKPLEPGEYSFLPILKGEEASNVQTTSGDFKIYCFGIDG